MPRSRKFNCGCFPKYVYFQAILLSFIYVCVYIWYLHLYSKNKSLKTETEKQFKFENQNRIKNGIIEDFELRIPESAGYWEEGENDKYFIYNRQYLASFQKFHLGKPVLKFLKEFQSPCILENTTEQFPYTQNNMMQHNNTYDKKSCFSKGLNQSEASFIQIPGLSRRYRLRCFPYAMLIGMPKSGSTDLFSRCELNKYTPMSFTKEFYYWDHFRYTAGASLGDYLDFFDLATAQLLKLRHDDVNVTSYYPGVISDFTTITMNDVAYWRTDPRNNGANQPAVFTPHDIYSILPEVKLIVLMRNPVNRLYSQYHMWAPIRGIRISPEDFHMRVVNSIYWWNNCTKVVPIRACLYGSPPEVGPVEYELSSEFTKHLNRTGLIRIGFYYLFITDWFKVFPRNQFLFIKTEEYNSNELEILNNKVFPFLNVPGLFGSQAEQIQSMSKVFKNSYAPMLPETRTLLQEFYQPFNNKLADLLGESKWTWKD